MKLKDTYLYGIYTILALSLVAGIGLVWLAPKNSDITLAMVSLLSATVGWAQKALSTVGDYLFGSSEAGEEKHAQETAQQVGTPSQP